MTRRDGEGWKSGITKCAHCRESFTVVLPAEEKSIECRYCGRWTRLNFVLKNGRDHKRQKDRTIYVFEREYFEQARKVG